MGSPPQQRNKSRKVSYSIVSEKTKKMKGAVGRETPWGKMVDFFVHQVSSYEVTLTCENANFVRAYPRN